MFISVKMRVCVCAHMCDTINPLQHYLSISHDKKRWKSKFKNSWQHTKSNKKHQRKGRNIIWHYSIKKALLFVRNKYSYTLSEAKTSHTHFWNKSTIFFKLLMLFLWRSLFLLILTILLLTYLPSYVVPSQHTSCSLLALAWSPVSLCYATNVFCIIELDSPLQGTGLWSCSALWKVEVRETTSCVKPAARSLFILSAS